MRLGKGPSLKAVKLFHKFNSTEWKSITQLFYSDLFQNVIFLALSGTVAMSLLPGRLVSWTGLSR